MPGAGGGRVTFTGPGFVGAAIGLFIGGAIALLVREGWTILLVLIASWAGGQIGDAVDKRLKEPAVQSDTWTPPPPGAPADPAPGTSAPPPVDDSTPPTDNTASPTAE